MPLIASNRIGIEHARQNSELQIRFYGSSFIADGGGALVAEADQQSETRDHGELRSGRAAGGAR